MVHAIRRSTVSRDMVRATVSPALCVVAQGAKVVVLGREVHAYDSSRMITYPSNCRSPHRSSAPAIANPSSH